MPTSLFVAVVAYAVPVALEITAGSLLFALVSAATALTVSSLFASKSDDSLADDSKASLSTGRDPVAPWQWIYGQTRVGGAITFLAVSESPFGEINGVLNMVITLAGHEVEEIGDIYANDELLTIDGQGIVTSGTFFSDGLPWMIVKKSLGNETTQPFPLLVSGNCGWTDAHRQNGRAKLYIWMRFSKDVFARGVPKFTAVVKGRKVFDPRSGLTAWSDNAALCISDYLTDEQVGIGADYASEIDSAQLIAAANTCDEAVSLAAGGTEKRYTMNGAFKVAGAPRETLARLLTAMNGQARFIGGTWKLYPAVYASPTITLTADDLRGNLHVMPRVSKRDLCNRVKGIFQSPANFWQPADFPPVTNATYLADDQGEELWRELDLPYTNSASMAQRIAKIELERVRQQISVEWAGKLTCYRLQPGDTVMVTLARYGWSSKVFEVSASKLAFEDAGGGIVVGCDLVLRETASAVYDWNSGEETAVDPAPDTDLPDAFNVSAPGNPVITEALYETRDGRGVAAKAIMTWGAAADAFVRSYQPEFRAVGVTAYAVLPRTESLTADVLDVAAGRYDFRVKAINQIGVESDYATTLNAEIIGLGDIPADPVIRGFQAGGDGITGILTLEPHPALDVRRGGRWRIRHTEGDSPDPVSAWAFSFSIGDAEGYSGDQTIIQLPLKNGSYLVKAEDAVGTQSTGFAFIVVKQASVHLFTLTHTLTEDPGFSGAKVDVVAVDSLLKLEGAGLVDSIPDWDAISSLDNYGGVEADGTYSFANRFDFGAISRRRISTEIQGQTVNVNDLIDDRLDNIDDWLDFDGSLGGGSTDAWVEMRETDVTPADGFADFDGTATCFASTPDSAALDITGDIDIRALVGPDDWTPGGGVIRMIATKFDTANRSYRFELEGSGGLTGYWTTDGNTDISRTSTAVVGAVDGTYKWVRWTLDVDNGAGGHDAKFWTSVDYNPITRTGTWTQLGTTLTTAGTTSIFSGSARLMVGSGFTGSASFNWQGGISYVEVLNGIDGAAASLFWPHGDAEPRDTSWISRTGETWTLSGSAVLDTDWSVWKRLDTAAVEAWAAELRLRVISSDAAYNMHINTLRATAESV